MLTLKSKGIDVKQGVIKIPLTVVLNNGRLLKVFADPNNFTKFLESGETFIGETTQNRSFAFHKDWVHRYESTVKEDETLESLEVIMKRHQRNLPSLKWYERWNQSISDWFRKLTAP